MPPVERNVQRPNAGTRSPAVVGFIGLGAMGSRMARRLLDRRHELVVWNRTREKLSELRALGAHAGESPADVARRADVVLTMVTDPSALRDVTEGTEGVASGASGSTAVIEMSTVGPAAVGRLASVLPKDTPLLDAPVLGSLSEAESGSLKIFVGGPVEVYERWAPLLAEMGSVLHAGPLGAGAASKLVANTTLFGILGTLGEALAVARALGLSREKAFEVLAETPLAAQAERRRPSIESGEYPSRFALPLARKDIGLILDAAAAGGADLRIVEAMRKWFEQAEAAGWGDRDYSSVLHFMVNRTRQ
ncbi:MAG TPA: NAD(P)-dependent oxidoreductase [Actinomycetota bacterium]|nr:NAD(P)-dependent oxidoreductase [Actinomycetota bacterium]